MCLSVRVGLAGGTRSEPQAYTPLSTSAPAAPSSGAQLTSFFFLPSRLGVAFLELWVIHQVDPARKLGAFRWGYGEQREEGREGPMDGE